MKRTFELLQGLVLAACLVVMVWIFRREIDAADERLPMRPPK